MLNVNWTFLKKYVPGIESTKVKICENAKRIEGIIVNDDTWSLTEEKGITNLTRKL